MFDKKLLGDNIKREREKQGMTQAQLAEKLYITYQSVSSWERGTNPPEIENICRLSEIFGITVDGLLFSRGSSEKHFVAVDGGGTKTEFVLFNEIGEVLKRVQLSESNPNSVGVEKCCSILMQGIDVLREEQYKISAVFAGIAGGKSSGAEEQIVSVLKNRYGSCSVGCDSDIVNILGFASDPYNAAGMICGTGSNVFFRKNGEIQYIGGWGYYLDEGGSGFDIGRDALREALAVYDGLKPETELSRLVTEETGEPKKNLGKLYKMGVHGLAAFAPIVFRAAEAGEKTAISILNRNAERMAVLIQSALKKSGFTGSIIGGGGLLRDAIYRDMIREKAGVEIEIPSLPPIYGAAVECCLRNGYKPDKAFYKEFEKSYRRKAGNA